MERKTPRKRTGRTTASPWNKGSTKDTVIENKRPGVKPGTKKLSRPDMYPWSAIEQHFVQGTPDATGRIHYPTINELALEFGASYNTIRKKMHKGKWIKKREEWQKQMQQRIWEDSLDNYVKTGQKFDASCISVAQRAMHDILKHFQECAANGVPMSIGDLDRLGRASLNWQKIGRLALGLSTENNAVKEEQHQQVPAVDMTLLSDDELKTIESLLIAAETRKHQVQIAQNAGASKEECHLSVVKAQVVNQETA